MVTTINDELRFIDCTLSEDPNEKALGEKALKAFEAVMSRMSGVLKYLATERISTADMWVTKAVTLIKTGERDLVLDWRGNLQQKNESGLYEMIAREDVVYLPFRPLLQSMHDVLASAEERKKTQMEAFAERRTFVDGLLNELEGR